jgi:hypothetical protein
MKVRTSSCEERGHLGTMRYMRKPLLKGHWRWIEGCVPHASFWVKNKLWVFVNIVISLSTTRTTISFSRRTLFHGIWSEANVRRIIYYYEKNIIQKAMTDKPF